MTTKITVIIPTRERCDVLEKSLATVVAQDYDNLEIVVSDNASTDATRDVALATGDSRLRYVNPGKRLNMTANWEFALGHVTEGWVTIIGDDDGLVPRALKQVAELISSGASAIRSEACRYLWPSPNIPGGRLSIPAGRGTEWRSSAEWLERVLCGDASYLELPMLYNGGFVRCDVLEKLRGGSGAVLRSCIPDVYSAVAIASVTDRYLYSRELLTIDGASSHSTGTSLFSRSENRANSPGRLFRSEENLPFHPDMSIDLRRSFPASLQALVYESYLQSSFLRPTRSTLHREQLELILSESDPDDTAVRDWAAEFARVHALDVSLARRRAHRRWRRSRGTEIVRRAWRALNTHVLTGDEAAIASVYHASLAVDAISKAPPGRLKRAHRWARRMLKRSPVTG